MNIVSIYVLRVAAFLIFSVLFDTILPAGSVRKHLQLILGLLFMYVLVQPVISWIEEGTPLESLTLESAAAADLQENPFEEQAEKMMAEGYAQVLYDQGLPPELRSEYELEEVSIGDTVQVKIKRNNEPGGWQAGELELGSIGVSTGEVEKLHQSLQEYWGLAPEDLEMELR